MLSRTEETLTVVPRKASVTVLDWGTRPLAKVAAAKGKEAFIPHGVKIRTHSDNEDWIAETNVDADTLEVSYRFSLPSRGETGPWFPNPTAAYKEINKLVKCNPSKGSNGQLIVGITYESLQKRVWEIFNPTTLERELPALKHKRIGRNLVALEPLCG